MISKSEMSALIKQEALKLGFSACGIAKADYLHKESKFLNNWLKNGNNADLDYMQKNKEKRLDPRKLVENAKSIIVVLLNYYPHIKQKHRDAPQIAKYAYGKDYHKVVKSRLWKLHKIINTQIISTEGRAFIDTAPIMEHAWAVRAGLGWQGKNTQIINKEIGSFVFIGELVLDIELAYDNPFNNEYCGSCTLCQEACPTNALEKAGVVNANKCIAYWTIENKKELPKELKGQFKNWAFGCDICQDVCPWNKNIKPNELEDLNPPQGFIEMTKDDWMNLSWEQYKEIFKGTSLGRTGYDGLRRNLDFISK